MTRVQPLSAVKIRDFTDAAKQLSRQKVPPMRRRLCRCVGLGVQERGYGAGRARENWGVAGDFSGTFCFVRGTFRGLFAVQAGKALTALKETKALVRAYLSSTR